MRYSFQHYVDIQTSSTSLNIITIKAGGEYILNRCKHLFGTYKYFKLGRVKVKLLPASTLPVDPMGLSMVHDDPYTVDPRDQMNPGLVRITNGENIFKELSGLSDIQLEEMYTNTMLDPRWSKFMLQAGFSRSAIPLFWDIAMPQQSQFPSANQQAPIIPNLDTSSVTGSINLKTYSVATPGLGQSVANLRSDPTDTDSFLQIGHKKKMGWLPTDAYEEFLCKDAEGNFKNSFIPIAARIPTTDLITVVLPKAHKTIYYYRLFITETVYFSGIKNVGVTYDSSGTYFENRAIDNFNAIQSPTPVSPASIQLQSSHYPYKE